ncbi:MAG: hypothetical protein ACQESF_03800 [Nanobdellota archaeon]
MLNTIECMDCLVYLKKVPDNHVDLVVTDPPYNVSQKQDIKYKDFNITKNFGDWDFGFDPVPVMKELKRVLKIGKIDKKYGGKKSNYVTKGIRLYDFRHCSACYWLPRYKSEAALKYRFGWKKSDMIHYYTDFMGMMDTIETEDLYVDVSKMELEKQMEQKNREVELLQEQLNEQGQKLQKVMQVIEALELEKEVKF